MHSILFSLKAPVHARPKKNLRTRHNHIPDSPTHTKSATSARVLSLVSRAAASGVAASAPTRRLAIGRTQITPVPTPHSIHRTPYPTNRRRPPNNGLVNAIATGNGKQPSGHSALPPPTLCSPQQASKQSPVPPQPAACEAATFSLHSPRRRSKRRSEVERRHLRDRWRRRRGR